MKCNLVLVKNEIQNSTEENESFTLTSLSTSGTKVVAPRKAKEDSLNRVWDEETKTLRYACSLCPRNYKSSNSLYVHMKSHEGKVYRYPNKETKQCKLCGKEVNTLSAHLKEVHVDIRKFPCSFCEKSFKRKLHLTVHARSHTGERPYKCYFCDKQFHQPADRNKHMSALHDFNNKKTDKVPEDVPLHND